MKKELKCGRKEAFLWFWKANNRVEEKGIAPGFGE